ncbi:Outer membrane receptor proteins, mostly Fe transport [Rhodothermus profundi]|uniref:Outer membrane receptor proteins, mostly Fe transport n=1 Tax=Rhodothermus profundi TaxID=633813 RepID=A0A1M6W1S4_9BACT|nr:Outer membrane receptor proteins, mostly Fe transport [Rhodothermus profundi]
MIAGSLLFGSAGITVAQEGGRFTLVVRDAPLQAALETLARTARINLVYPTELVRGQTVSCALREAPVEQLLRCLLAGTGLDFVRSSSGAYVILAARELPPRLGLLTGQVVDGTTGAPLPFAHVLLADAGTGTVTNEAGLFTLSGLLAGPHRLVVSYVGYRPRVDSVRIEPGRPVHVRIALEPTLLEAPPIVIDGLTRRPLSADLGQEDLNAGQLQHDAAGDLLQMIGRLPGIQVPHPLAELHLQGGDSGEHLTLLDGMPVRNPVSLGRYLSAFSPLAIGRLTVHRAGYGVALGSQLAGLIELEHDLSVPGPLDLGVRVDPLAANARIRGRYQNAAALVAVRRSIWGLYQEPGLRMLLRQWNSMDPFMAARWLGEAITREGLQAYHWEPRAAFSDLHAAGRMQIDPFQTLHVTLYQGTNRLEADQQTRYAAAHADSARLILTQDTYRWLNQAFRFRYDRLLGARALLSLGLRGSWHASTYRYRAREGSAPSDDPVAWEALEVRLRAALDDAPGTSERNAIRELALATTLHYSLSSRWQLEGGVLLEQVQAHFRLGNVLVAPFRHRITVWQPAAYLTATWRLKESLSVEPGIRLTWLPARATVYAEPRLTMRRDAQLGPFSVAMRLSGGLYRQFVNQFELTSVGATAIVPSVLFWLPSDGTVAPSWAYHLTGELLLTQKDVWRIDAVLYHKGQPHLLIVDYPGLLVRLPVSRPNSRALPLKQRAFLRHTQGMARGLSLRLRYQRTRERIALSYSYDRTWRAYPDSRGTLRRHPAPWNEPHRLRLDFSFHLPASLIFSGSWQASWGRRWAFRRLYYDYLRYTGSPLIGGYNLDQPERHRLPGRYRLDLGLSWRGRFRRALFQVQLLVRNVLDRREVYDRSLMMADPVAPEPIDRYLPGRQWLLTMQVGY